MYQRGKIALSGLCFYRCCSGQICYIRRTSGKTQGEKNESIPAVKATRYDISLKVDPMFSALNQVAFSVRFSACTRLSAQRAFHLWRWWSWDAHYSVIRCHGWRFIDVDLGKLCLSTVFFGKLLNYWTTSCRDRTRSQKSTSTGCFDSRTFFWKLSWFSVIISQPFWLASYFNSCHIELDFLHCHPGR